FAGHIMGDRPFQGLRTVARNGPHDIALGQDANHAIAFTNDQGPDLAALQLGAGFIQRGVRRQRENSAPLALENLGDQHGDLPPYGQAVVRGSRTGRMKEDRFAQTPPIGKSRRAANQPPIGPIARMPNTKPTACASQAMRAPSAPGARPIRPTMRFTAIQAAEARNTIGWNSGRTRPCPPISLVAAPIRPKTAPEAPTSGPMLYGCTRPYPRATTTSSTT